MTAHKRVHDSGATSGRLAPGFDPEKSPSSSFASRSRSQSLDHDEESYYYSDYPSYGPSKPILDLTPPSQQRRSSGILPRKKRRFNFSRGGPHSIMRWTCLGIFGVLVVFVVFLFRVQLAGSSLAPVELSRQDKPPPPKWEEFSFLKRFYGGVRTIVPREKNNPEYPNDDPEDVKDPELEEEEEEEKEDQEKDKKGGKEKEKEKEKRGKDSKKGEEGKKGEEAKKGDKNDDDDDDSTPKLNLTASSSVFNPYPDYASQAYIDRYGKKVDCGLGVNETLVIPQLRKFDGVPNGFPDPAIGSNELVGINDTVCFDRFGRLGPYGFGYGKKSGGMGAGLEGDREGIEDIWDDVPPVDFRGANWAEAQERCVAANKHRFPPGTTDPLAHLNSPKAKSPKPKKKEAGKKGEQKGETKGDQKGDQKGEKKGEEKGEEDTTQSKALPRTAIVIRTWHDYKYDDETILYLRALITELSLMSGGEYEVYFLIHVKDEGLQIWSDDETHERVLRDSLPEEFRGMGVLWSEKLMGLVYSGLEESWERGLPVHGVYRSTFMPMQYFAFQHPDYDYYWNWEMDVRYTGHWYHFFDRVVAWAKEQPRKGLWERNARFYVPSVHGSWEDFKQRVRFQTEMGTNSPNNLMGPAPGGGGSNGKDGSATHGDKPIWGPERPPAKEDVLEVDGEGAPPTSYEKDKHQWGVGEDADLIVFNPLYDPEGTTWLLRDDFTGYKKDAAGKPPRRTAIITASRLSRKLLHTMHRETALKRHTMFSEMWPATTCLHHGFKAVYVPHSMYIDRRWPTNYLESVFNAGRNGASGGARTAIFGDREHNFLGTTWFYSAGHSGNLWRRWLGYKVNNDGGEEVEEAGEGRMCLPPMLLHPVKEVELTIESADGQET